MNRPQDIQEAEVFVRNAFPDLKNTPLGLPEQGSQSFVMLTDNEAIKVSAHERADRYFLREMQSLLFLNGRVDTNIVPQVNKMMWNPPVMRMQRMAGQPLVDDITNEFDILSEWPAHEQKKTGEEIGRMLAQLHAVPFDDQAREQLQPTGFITWNPTYIDGFKPFFAERGADSLKRLSNGVEFLKQYREDGEHLSFAHMDVSPRNVLRMNDGNLGLLDYGAACIMPSYLEFVRPISFFPPEIWQPALNTYEAETGRTIDHDKLQGALDLYYSVRVICDVREAYAEPRHIIPVTLDHS